MKSAGFFVLLVLSASAVAQSPLPRRASGAPVRNFGGAVPEASRADEVANQAGASVAFVEGEKGVGSGFICTYQGKRMLFTNQHVVRENPTLRFTLVDQTRVKLGVARAAVGHDLMAFDVAEPLPALATDLDFKASVAIGDEVVVIGNTEGQRVIKPLPGKIVGVGPNLLEVTSAFQPGNSGSPIIHVKSGRVIGIATYAVVRNVDSLTGARAPSVRRFGYRLDSVQQWQPVNWPLYQSEAAACTKVHELSGALIQLLVDVHRGSFDPDKVTESRLRPAVGYLLPLLRSGSKSKGDVDNAVRNFLGELKSVSQRDVTALLPQLRYDFFRREMGEEAKFRAELAKDLGDAVSKRQP